MIIKQSSSIESSNKAIGSYARPLCDLCGRPGELLYRDLEDKLFDAPGLWNLKRCSDIKCGVAWLDPAPLPEEIAKAYANYYTHEDGLLPSNNRWARIFRRLKQGYLAAKYGYHKDLRATWKRTLGLLMYFVPNRRAYVDAQVFYLPAKSHGRLLDVGCGSGSTLARMAALGWQVEGVEPDPLAVNRALSKGLRVHQGELYAQRFAPNYFDAVVMNHVIEHVDGPVSLLKECFRILSPGGRLIILTPNIGSWGHRIYRRHWRGLEPPRHLNIFTLASLSRVAAAAGFQTFQCQSIAQGASYILAASRSLRRNDRGAKTTGCSLMSGVWVTAVSIAEWAVSSIDREAGEELVLIATK